MDFVLTSSGIENGMIHAKYGRLNDCNNVNGIPQISIPLAWCGQPPDTKAFAIVCIDYDNYEDQGFAWLHWSVANIPAHIRELPENASLDMCDVAENILQGKNTWMCELDPALPECNRYGGPAPVDRSHWYEFRIFALSDYLDLEDGYYHNHFLEAIDEKILEEAVLYGEYRI